MGADTVITEVQRSSTLTRNSRPKKFCNAEVLIFNNIPKSINIIQQLLKMGAFPDNFQQFFKTNLLRNPVNAIR